MRVEWAMQEARHLADRIRATAPLPAGHTYARYPVMVDPADALGRDMSLYSTVTITVNREDAERIRSAVKAGGVAEAKVVEQLAQRIYWAATPCWHP